ncbi:reverse transcriptase domain-containing protein [Tanacetum coccineum]
MSTSTSAARNETELLLKQLDLGVTGTIMVMVCRMWDVHAATGRYLSTDLIFSDAKGDLMHCTARGNITHNFLWLKEGVIYSVKNFTIVPNKDEFCVMRFAELMLEFDGETTVRKSFVKSNGFTCYPFQFVKIDALEPTNNRYLIDRLYLSSTSSTLIIDDEKIPVLQRIKTDDSVELTKEILPVDNAAPKP